MENAEIAKILREIAVFLEMDDVPFKPHAYEKAARSIETLDRSLAEIYGDGGLDALMEIPGVGEAISKKIEEMLKTGRLRYHEELKRKVPVDVDLLTAIEGIGPKTVRDFYRKLGVKTVGDLEEAAKTGRIRDLTGFGEKSEEKILEGTEFFRRSLGRLPLGDVLPMIRDIQKRLTDLSEVSRIAVAGSVRRWKETVGDIDLLTTSDQPRRVMKIFVSLPQVTYVHSHGKTKSSVRLRSGTDADLRVIPEKSFGAALQYFTGSKDHNIALRKKAIVKGWKLNEYGLFEGKEQIAGDNEEEIYRKLGLKWIPPELREDTGEIEATQRGDLPNLIGYGDLKGDLQIHTRWTDGDNTIEEMAAEAAKTGLQYIAISDHTKGLGMGIGLDENDLERQRKEIEKANRIHPEIEILRGCEANIQKDGTLDLDSPALTELDIVGAGVHHHFDQPIEEQTRRLIAAMENENVDIIFHPTAREINRREPIHLDFEKILQAAKDTGTILEIDAFPNRLDLKDEHVRRCVESGVKMTIDTDAHTKTHLRFRELGVATARRGWATAEDILNTRSLKDLLNSLK
jgi:DNA polymerase (family 10)